MIVCPTITSSDLDQYSKQINNVVGFAERIHIDLMDGLLAPTKSLDVASVWLPEDIICDVHVMYQSPQDIIDSLIKLKPNLVIIHAEAQVDHKVLADQLHIANIKAGLALLPPTTVDSAAKLINNFDQVLVFGGHLGYQGGKADLGLLDKVRQLKAQYPQLELAWDGGINDQNAQQIVAAGIDVLNVGAFIQSNPDPKAAYAKLINS